MNFQASINDKIDFVDFGGGVCLFKTAVLFDELNVFETFASIVRDERESMFTETVDPESGKPTYINRSGYLFSKESIDVMPYRASSIFNGDNVSAIEFLNMIEDAKDACLLRYFSLYPYAYNCVWWKVKGHVVAYPSGAFLGPHSDISAEYVYGVHKTSNELALRNVISTVTYLNTSGTSSTTSFRGGDHVFEHLGIRITPSRGDILFFPSNYVAAHRVEPSYEGMRLSYLGWYSQGTPNPAVGEDVIDPLTQPDGANCSTNVYMPTLRDDYRRFLLDNGFTIDSPQYRSTNIGSQD